ncbi:MAG TPA: hypothetical protein VFQ39_08130 [Longimicrobium sp.]|nr:hypothetical protein [Longimicrobium sp.]
MSRIVRTAALVALAFAAAGTTRAAAQAAPAAVTARNAVYVELLGNGVLYSVNYDRRLTDNVAGRVGVSFLTVEEDDGDRGTLAMAPIVASYLFGEGNSHFEAGLGVLLASASVSDVGDDEGEDWFDLSGSASGVLGTGVLGYRYQRPDGGFVFRAGLTPIFDTEDFIPWFGVSFGYAF